MKIVHLISVHTWFDTRIFLKQCRSLADHVKNVALVVSDCERDMDFFKLKIITLHRT